MTKIRRYCKLMGVFAKYSLMSALEYRINFVTGMTVEMGWMVIKLMYVAIIYKAGTNIGILTPDHILLFIGTYVLMTGIYMLYFGNFCSIPGMVSGKAGVPAVSCDHAPAGICVSAAESGGRCVHDCNRMAVGRTSGQRCVHSRISFLPGLRMSADLQPVPGSLYSGLLDYFRGRNFGHQQCAVGFQQYALHDLRKVVSAGRDLYSADFCDYEFPRTVPDGRAVPFLLCLGCGGAGAVLRAGPNFLEDFPKEVQQRQLLIGFPDKLI